METQTLRTSKVWQGTDHNLIGGPESLNIKIAKKASKWHVVVTVKATGQQLLDQEVPTLDYGMEVIKEYLSPITAEAKYLDYTPHKYIGWNAQHYAA